MTTNPTMKDKISFKEKEKKKKKDKKREKEHMKSIVDDENESKYKDQYSYLDVKKM